MFEGLNNACMNTSLSCPYCIGLFNNKKLKIHAMMSNMNPICGAKNKEPNHIDNRLTLQEAVRKLEKSNGCGNCRRILKRQLNKGI